MSEGAMVRISAVICTLNRAAYLAKAMESLVNQTYPKEYYEIIVVDNGSTDNTREVVEQFSQLARIRYIHEPIKGLSRARNTGWQAASGKYVAYLDDDAIACPHWLDKMMEAFETAEPRPASVGGKAVPLWESERPAWLEDRMLGAYAIVDWGKQARFFKPLSPEHHVGCNIAYTRTVLQECGGFNVNLGRKGGNLLSNDENLIRQYIDSHGLGIYYDPEILVEHVVPKERLTRRFMLRRRFWQGISDVVLWYEESPSTPGRLWLLMSGLEGLAWSGLYLTWFFLRFFLRRPWVVVHDLATIETVRTYLFRSLYHPSCSFGQSSGYLQLGMGHLAQGISKVVSLDQESSGSSRPPPKNWNRITWLSYPYLILKGNFFGMGGIFFLAIIGLYIAGALIEPLRWYLIGTASGLLLLCCGVLVLSYIRLILNRLARDQRAQVSNINKQISNINKQVSGLKKEMKTIERELSTTKDDVFIIGYDILKEQNKLAEKVSQLETKAGNDRRTKRSPKKSIE